MADGGSGSLAAMWERLIGTNTKPHTTTGFSVSHWLEQVVSP